MKFKEKKIQDNFLQYIPRRKHNNWEVRGGKVYLIFNHDKVVEKFLRWLVKKPYVSDIELDDLGSRVWQLVDGKSSILEIGEEILKQCGKSSEPIYEKLTMYFGHLNRKGWISFERGLQDQNVKHLEEVKDLENAKNPGEN
jgi:ribosomal protein S8